MRASNQLNRRLPDQFERFAMIIGAVVGWILFALFVRFAATRLLIMGSILSVPCVLLLTYFAFGGDIPLRFRQKGYRRIVLVPIFFWLSFLAAVVVIHFLHLSGD